MRILTCVVIGCLAAGNAQAQPDFSRVRAQVGQRLVVTQGDLTFEGTLRALSDEAMTVGDREIVPTGGLVIERDNGHVVARSVGWGALGGALVGLLGMRRAAPALGLALPGALVGAMAGAAQDSRTTLYDTRGTTPAVAQLALPPHPFRASLTFAGLSVRPGDRVFVRDGPIAATGLVNRVTANTLVLDGWTFTPHANLTIAREGDPVWDGAAYGFALGALLGPTVGAESCIGKSTTHCALEAGFETAALGALIDWSHKGWTTVYDTRPHPEGAAAFLSRHVVPLASMREKRFGLMVIAEPGRRVNPHSR